MEKTKKRFFRIAICIVLSIVLVFDGIGITFAADKDERQKVAEGQEDIAVTDEAVDTPMEIERIEGESSVGAVKNAEDGERQAKTPELDTRLDWQDYTYEIDSDTLTVEIVRYNGEDTTIKIPGQIEGFTVTSLSKYAFISLQYMAKIILPESIQYLDSETFDNEKIEEVQIDNPYYKTQDGMVYSVDGTELVFASSNCKGSFTFTKKLEKYPYSFLNHTKIDTLVFEEGITRIPPINWGSVEKVVFPSTLEADQTKHGWGGSFEDAKPGVDIEVNITYDNLFVPMDVVGRQYHTSEYVFSGSNPYYTSMDGVIYTADMKKLVAYPPMKTDTKYKVPNSVIWIMQDAFRNNSYLEEVQLPEGLIRIDSAAFYGLANLKKINIPKKAHICNLIQYVFSGCSAKVYTNYDNMFAKNLRDGWISGFYGELIYNDAMEVHYNPNGGILQDPENEYYMEVEGSCYCLPSVSRTGYTFKGWYTKKSGGKKIEDNAMVSLDGPKTLYAQWKAGYTITYQLDGGTNNAGNPKTYTNITKPVTLKSPTKKGYTFKGWYSDSARKKKVTVIPKGCTGNKTYYAKWVVNRYTIAFYGNGGSGFMKKLSCQYSKDYKLPVCTYRKKGYVFTGWNTKKNGKGKAYGNKCSVKSLSSKDKTVITLYAQWKKKRYTITYNMAGGGENHKENPRYYDASTGKIILKNPTRTGFTFKGWYSDIACKKKITAIPKGSTGDKTIYAKWEVNKYTIVFRGNGSDSGGMKKIVGCKYGTYYTIPKAAYKKKGYTFTGWNTHADGKGKSYSDQDRQCNYTSKNNGTVTLYAQWKKTAYKITYKMDGGTNSEKNPQTYNISTSKIVFSNPDTRTGYTFLGWYSDARKTKRIKSIPKGSTGNKTIYAKWKEHTYSVTFEGNGSAGGSMNTLTGKRYSESYNLPECGFMAAEGFVFVGWNTAIDGSGIGYSGNETVSKLTGQDGGKIVLYAQWKLEKKNLNGRIQDEMEKFPAGAFWSHVVNTVEDMADILVQNNDDRFADEISSVPCKNHNRNGGGEPIPGTGQYDCNCFDRAIQCMGFAKKVFYDIWGQKISELEIEWNPAEVEVGDYVRVNNNSHSAFVIGVDNDKITVIECNLDWDGPRYNCMIRHNYQYPKSSVTYRVHARDYSMD